MLLLLFTILSLGSVAAQLRRVETNLPPLAEERSEETTALDISLWYVGYTPVKVIVDEISTGFEFSNMIFGLASHCTRCKDLPPNITLDVVVYELLEECRDVDINSESFGSGDFENFSYQNGSFVEIDVVRRCHILTKEPPSQVGHEKNYVGYDGTEYGCQQYCDGDRFRINEDRATGYAETIEIPREDDSFMRQLPPFKFDRPRTGLFMVMFADCAYDLSKLRITGEIINMKAKVTEPSIETTFENPATFSSPSHEASSSGTTLTLIFLCASIGLVALVASLAITTAKQRKWAKHTYNVVAEGVEQPSPGDSPEQSAENCVEYRELELSKTS